MSNTIKTLLKQKTIGSITIKIEVIDFCEGSFWFRDLYTASEHIAGETIQVPLHLQKKNYPKFYIGQTSPKELTRLFAKEGKINPSKEAYLSLQRDLEHYIQASDCSIKYTVYKNNIELVWSYGANFDFSYVYYSNYEEAGKIFLKEEGSEKIKELILEAKEVLNSLCNCKG